jgi:hypothetical protein
MRILTDTPGLVEGERRIFDLGKWVMAGPCWDAPADDKNSKCNKPANHGNGVSCLEKEWTGD